MTNQWITKLPFRRDGLYEKFASPNEGWQISNGDIIIDVPLGKLDETAYRILADTIESNKRVVIALPRVKTGVSLSIIAYLVVNRFINQHGRSLQDFLPISLNIGQSIIITTQNRKLRDFFLLSSLKFAGTSFPFTFFPIYRIKHTGELVSLVNRTEAKVQIKINPIVFYHFDKLDTLPQSLNNGCLLGEFIETNSSDLASKLCDFIDQLSIKSSLLLVNQYSDSVLLTLKNRGFRIVTFGADDILKAKSTSNQNISDLPSLNSSLVKFPSKIALKLHLVEDKEIETKLTKIIQTLLSLNNKFINTKPSLLLKAWGIFYLLKDLSVPLESLEQYRKRNPWLKTIKHNISQTFQFPLDKLDEITRTTLAPIWGTLESEFTDLYSYLEKRNPKYEYIKDLASKTQITNTVIVFPSQGQAEVLKEEMLINGMSKETGDETKVAFINELIKNSQQYRKLVLPGIWRKHEEAKILSLLPNEINVVCYSSELPAVPSLLKRLNIISVSAGIKETHESIKELEPSVDLGGTYEVTDNWISPDNDSQFYIDYFKEFVPQGTEEIPDFNKIEWLSNPAEDIEEDSEVDETESTDKDETVPAYKITLENDRSIFIPVDQEVMAYSEDEEIQSKLAEVLQPGDIILLYSQEQNREMFDSVLQRTQELSGVDPRILSLWKTAIKLLREKYDIVNPNSLRAYLHDLKDKGCQKTEQATKMWLKGTTLAPRDLEDIGYLLDLIEYKNISTMSKLIHREIGNIRVFHRLLGRRLKAKLGNLIRGHDATLNSIGEPIDREIDEILEMADPIAIKEVSKDIKYVQKKDVKVNVMG